ncbi:MAG: hypothetical protein R2728_10225 [Chitinophagales bacterium]
MEVNYPNAANQQKKTIPIEDIGIIVLEHPQITITNSIVIQAISDNKDHHWLRQSAHAF